MNCEPVICNGNELEATLNNLREQRMVPWAVDAMVKTNAGYRVSYFESAVGIGSEHRRQECVGGIKCQQVSNPAALTNFDRVTAGMAAAASKDGMRNLEPPAVSRTGPNRVPVSSFPQQGETPEKRFASNSVKGAVAPRNPLQKWPVNSSSKVSQETLPCREASSVDNGAETVAVDSNFVMRQDRSDATQTSTRHVSEGGEALKPRGGELYQRNVSTRVSTKADTTEALGSGLAHPSHNDSIESRLAVLQSKLAASGRLKRNKPREARLPHPND